jgi:hypothetical protein
MTLKQSTCNSYYPVFCFYAWPVNAHQFVDELTYWRPPCRCAGGYSQASHHKSPQSVLGRQSVWDLPLTDWHSQSFSSKYLFSAVSITPPLLHTFIRLNMLHNTVSSQGRATISCNKYTLRYLHVRQYLFVNKYRLIICKEPTWCNLAVCLLVTAIILYMFRTLFASILRST